MRGRAVWITGLPGAGKSTVAKAVHDALLRLGVDAVWLRMDERRKAYFPKPDYSDRERESAYRMFVDEAAGLAAQGKTVLMDATAHKLIWRDLARQRIPDFAEVALLCPLETAMQREAGRPGGLVMADLYAKAIERRRTGREFPGLGPMVGVDVAFEPNPDAELVLNAGTLGKDELRDRVLDLILSKRPRARQGDE